MSNFLQISNHVLCIEYMYIDNILNIPLGSASAHSISLKQKQAKLPTIFLKLTNFQSH